MLVANFNDVKVESVPLNSSRSSPPPSGDRAFSYVTRRRGVARFTVGGNPVSHAESPPAV
jgi:hypothetical protein